MRTRFHEAMAAALLLLAPVAGNSADVSFAYQGLLLDEKGHLLPTRNHSIVFCIYDQASGGSPLWTCTRNVLLDEKGQFSVELSGNPIHGAGLCEMFAANAQKSLYLGLTVDKDTAEISPRQRLMSVPKAFWADDSVAAKEDMSVANALYGNAASLRYTSANALAVANKLECGMLQVTPLTVTNGSLRVGGSITGSAKGVIPVGGIIVWSGSAETIPGGWALCDGSTHYGIQTPDLKGRFIVGAGAVKGKIADDPPGNLARYRCKDTGGEATHQLTEKEMPTHSHEFSLFGASQALAVESSKSFHYRYAAKETNTWTSTSAGNSSGAKLGAPHENRPPFYALCYIMRVK